MEPESRHLIAAHAVINKLNEKPGVQLDQIDGKDIIAQALADGEEKVWGHLRELARQVQRAVKRNDSDPAQEENALLLMADDVLSGRLLAQGVKLRAGIEELIENSSLGTPTTRWKALERLGDLMGWRSRSSVMSAQKTTKEQESINEVLHYADMLSSDLSGDAKKREGILYQLQQASRLLNSLRIEKKGVESEATPGILLSVTAGSLGRTMELLGSCRRDLGALRDADDGTDNTTRQVLGILVSAVSTLTAAVSNLVPQEKP